MDPPSLKVAALVAAGLVLIVALVVALPVALAFKVVKSRKKKEKHDKKHDKNKSKTKPTDANWEWPIFDEWYSRKTWSYERKQRGGAEGDDEKDSSPFEVTYRRREELPDKMTVTLFSSHLIAVLAKCLPKNNRAMTDTNPKISGQQLFLAMDTIRNYKIEEESEKDAVATAKKLEESENSTTTTKKLEESENSAATAKKKVEKSKKSAATAKKLEKSENDDTTAKKLEESENSVATAKLHVGHLLRFLEKEYKDTQTQYERMTKEGTTSWAMLWAFLAPGEKVYYHCQFSGQQVCGIVRLRHYYKHYQTGTKRLSVELDVMDYNGQSYRACNVTREILEFQNERSFTNLSVCPLRFAKQSEQMEAAFLANGKRFYKLSVKANSFMQFKGPLVRLEYIPGTSCSHVVKHKADGRVMIDLWSFARMNPGYDMENATPPTACDLMCGLEDSDNMPDDESLKLAPAIVYGFAFSIKQWGCFPVTGFSEISFDDHAFDHHLVMNDNAQKKMLLGLVSQYLQDPPEAENNNNVAEVDVVPSIDPISNKGEGCIFLCYGPPGTGKTLTAESVAEKLHRPLWAVSASELSFEVDKLEQKLVQIFDIASSWRAVLLLDEADIYLEKRTSAVDPKRNAMTGVFLRLLEYYKGVLFLTTNRVTTFDDAFCSRISMFLRYHRLTDSQRAKVWETLLSRVGLTDVNLEIFATHELNGREIRNTIRTAHTWATSCNQPLTTQHVLNVVKMLHDFREDLQDAALEESQVDNTFSSVLATLQQQPPAILNNNKKLYSNGDTSFKP
jgi:DNA polymerase III delta prime subunit